jgi:Lon protease-like protein
MRKSRQFGKHLSAHLCLPCIRAISYYCEGMQLPREVPVMTLPNAILFPGALLPLYIFEPRYRRMLADALHSHRLFAIAMQKPGRTREIPSAVAGLGLIRVAVTKQDATSYLIVQGLMRIELEEVVRRRPYRVQRVRPLQTPADGNAPLTALTDQLRALVAERLEQGIAAIPLELKDAVPVEDTSQLDSLAAFSLQHFLKYLAKLEDPGQVADLVSCTLLPKAEDRQSVLETVDLERRLHQVIQLLIAEIHRKKP